MGEVVSAREGGESREMEVVIVGLGLIGDETWPDKQGGSEIGDGGKVEE